MMLLNIQNVLKAPTGQNSTTWGVSPKP